MAGDALGRGDQRARVVGAEHLGDGLGFGSVVLVGRCAVRVDVPDLIGRDASVVHGQLHARDGTHATWRRGRDVVGIGGGGRAEDFARIVAPRLGEFPGLEDQNGGSLGHDEPITVRVERPAVASVREGGHVAEAGDRSGRERRLSASGHHDVAATVGDHASGIANRMGARCACGHGVLAWALPAITHRDGGGRRIGHHHRNKERGDPTLALGKTDLDLFFERADAADAGTDEGATSGRVGRDLPGLFECLGCGCQREWDAVASASFLRIVEVGVGSQSSTCRKPLGAGESRPPRMRPCRCRPVRRLRCR